jgi:hypothetical protein
MAYTFINVNIVFENWLWGHLNMTEWTVVYKENSEARLVS